MNLHQEGGQPESTGAISEIVYAGTHSCSERVRQNALSPWGKLTRSDLTVG